VTAAVGTAIEDRLAQAGLPGLPRTAWLEIDLDAIRGNIAAFRAALPAEVAIDPVVKGNAYGHGALPVARTVLAAGARGVCVATLDEALLLRGGGIGAPIMVMFPIPPPAVAEAAAARIAVVAGDAVLFDRLLASYAAARRARPDLPDLDVHVTLETGLGRDGLWPEEAVAAVRAARDVTGVQLVGAWSHLQAAEDRPRTVRQAARLEAALDLLEEAGFTAPRRHLLASGGVLALDAFEAGEHRTFDSVRVGIATYGIAPDDVVIRGAAGPVLASLRPAMSLHARPIRVTDVPTGEGIGYGPHFVTDRPSRIATLPIGYADGWPRNRGNRAGALVRGRRAPIVGVVAMDALMIDVTDIPGGPVTPDDEFVLLGAQDGDRISAEELARERNTVTWEVVAVMSGRLPRVYASATGIAGLVTMTISQGAWP
jgi:alanine racemase